MTTSAYERAEADAAQVLAEYIDEHPFVGSILKGSLTEQVYAAYLRETYHLVTQTPYFLSAAASHSDSEWLQDWFLDLARDERHHNRLCVRDLRNMGIDPDEYLGDVPGLGTWTMVAQNHYLARAAQQPVGIIGFAAATEGLGARLAPKVAEAMGQYAFAKDSLSFLKVHSMEDQEHIETVRKGFDRSAAESPEAYTVMLAAWKYTLRAYAQLFTDSLERGGSELAAASPRIG
ncbi:iron-containing redox enzyme family protein [Streptomyces sp. NPDC048057]|uniref:iron-containing redox enzyme family protein n=1 Tax=Streptomyces sp. NPDC048057 TaxID=3155628 RepID=UPI0033F2906E